MGYYTRFREEITITPGVPQSFADQWNEGGFLEDQKWTIWRLEPGRPVDAGVCEACDRAFEPTSASTILRGPEDKAKAYGRDAELAALLGALGPDREFSGAIYMSGEEDTDLTALVPKNGTLEVVKAHISYD